MEIYFELDRSAWPGALAEVDRAT